MASIAFRERLESMRLIEEFMVLANVAAAESLEKARTPLIYRMHERLRRKSSFAFSDFLRTLSISFAKGQVVKPGTFNRILASAKGGPHDAVMNDVVLRTQAQAIYAPANIGHFGLNLAALRAFHLAHPPLCRPHRPSRADPRPEAGRATASPTARSADWRKRPSTSP